MMSKRKKPSIRTLRKLEAVLIAEALALVEYKARAILRAHDNLDEFVMGMGGWFFTTKKHEKEYCLKTKQWTRWVSAGESENLGVDDVAYLDAFGEFMNEFDYLKLTGEPMRFTAHGDVVTDW